MTPFRLGIGSELWNLYRQGRSRVARSARRLIARRCGALDLSALHADVRVVLREVEELGFVRFAGGRVFVMPPKNNFWYPDVRWEPTIHYLAAYAHHHREFEGEFFLCLHDGWREHTAFVAPNQRERPPWLAMRNRSDYLRPGHRGEPRFLHPPDVQSVYPALPRKILAYNRHAGDDEVLLIPDAEFLANGFRYFRRQVRRGDSAWHTKKCQAVWRGNRNITTPSDYHDHGAGPKHPRELAVEFSTHHPDVLDASYDRMTIAEQLRYRYVLDLDGAVSAWSANYWKMLSNSLVVRYRSHWEGWYTARLRPGVHFVPFDSFHELPQVVDWCRAHDTQCRQIAANASRFIHGITYRHAIHSYRIQ